MLINIFKSFLRPHLDYGDVIYDRAYNTSFHQNIESIQYNAALAITGAVRRTSREELSRVRLWTSLTKVASIENFAVYLK